MEPTLPEKPPSGAVMSPKTRGLAAKAGFNLFFIISLLLCSCNAFPGPRFANSFRHYQVFNYRTMEVLIVIVI